MRNKYPGVCYRCGETVGVGKGHFERFFGSWRTQHAGCAIKFRHLKEVASGTGKSARTARKRLRDAQEGRS